MESQPTGVVPAPIPAGVGETSMSVWERTVAIFARPTAAWGGMGQRSQWWFPMVVMMIVNGLLATALHQRALVPMMVETWDQAVADGRMTAEQVDRMEGFMSGPVGMAVSVVQQTIAWPVILLVSALVVWFGVAFVLGTKMRYGLAFANVAWASLVMIPGQLLTGALAWSRQSMRGVHTGFGVLVPEGDPATKLQVALGFFLDAIGPLSLWYVAVLVLGAAALSGAPRKSVAWVLGGLYVGLMVFFAALVAMIGRGG